MQSQQITNQILHSSSGWLYEEHATSTTWHAKYNFYNCMTLHTYIQPGSLTQKYEAFRPLYFTWQDSSAGAMVGMINK